MEKGFGFEWKPGEPPKLLLPDGTVRVLMVDQYVPILASAPAPEKIDEENLQDKVAPLNAGGKESTSLANGDSSKKTPPTGAEGNFSRKQLGQNSTTNSSTQLRRENTSGSTAEDGEVVKAVNFGNSMAADLIPPGKLCKSDYRMLDLEESAKAESYDYAGAFRIREAFPAERLTFPVEEGSVKNMGPGILEERKDNEDNNSGPADDILAQTPQDVVPRETVHNTGGAATSEQTGHEQDERGANNDKLVRIHKTPRKRMYSPPQACHDIPPVLSKEIDVQRTTITNLVMLTTDKWAGGNSSKKSKSRNPTIMPFNLFLSKTTKKPLRPS